MNSPELVVKRTNEFGVTFSQQTHMKTTLGSQSSPLSCAQENLTMKAEAMSMNSPMWKARKPLSMGGPMTRALVISLATVALMCSGSAMAQAATSQFAVVIPTASQGTLPTEYTCDGQGVSPSLTWSGAPKGTKGYAIVMDHVPPEGGHHWYLLDWGIPAKTRSLPAGASNVGYLGGNSVNRDLGYAPPCSKGPGTKTYTISVFALSGTPKLPKTSTSSVTREQLLSAISGMTLSKAVLDVTYSR